MWHFRLDVKTMANAMDKDNETPEYSVIEIHGITASYPVFIFCAIQWQRVPSTGIRAERDWCTKFTPSKIDVTLIVCCLNSNEPKHSSCDHTHQCTLLHDLHKIPERNKCRCMLYAVHDDANEFGEYWKLYSKPWPLCAIYFTVCDDTSRIFRFCRSRVLYHCPLKQQRQQQHCTYVLKIMTRCSDATNNVLSAPRTLMANTISTCAHTTSVQTTMRPTTNRTTRKRSEVL